MSDNFDWLPDFVTQLKNENILLLEDVAQTLASTQLLAVDAEDWGSLAREAARAGLRWCAVWAEDRGDELLVSAVFEKQGGYLVARTQVDMKTAVLPSHTPHYIGADRPERHLQDMFGLVFTDHPDARRWTRHMAWGDGEFPLRKDFPAAGQPQAVTPPNNEYRFLQAQGPGVYEIPVGPVHAGIIEPGHFRFQAVGEMVLNLEEHLGYVHKGIEKIAEGRDPAGLARLAGRVSGDTTVAHAWAACMAMERAAGIEPPPRAVMLRALFAECERISNHFWDIAMVCNDVAYAFPFYQFSRVREQWLRLHRDSFGHRLLMDRIIPGGVAVDLPADAVSRLRALCEAARRELDEMMPILDDNASLQDRLVTTGILTPELAMCYGSVGFVGKASGLDFDVRRDAPYAPYDRMTVDVPSYTDGDVDARVKVRVAEIRVSSRLIEQLLERLPAGEIVAPWRAPAADAEGLGRVEGWRGEIIAYVRFAADNRIARYFPRDPSWTTWPALEKLTRGNIVPDFPVCNKSVNGSYSGHDL
jgi:Ni,Fe-hydrogenase III large subunit/NADH:ubiquinone oxidoreductase subunit C